MDNTRQPLHRFSQSDTIELVQATSAVTKHFLHQKQNYLHLLEMKRSRSDSFLLLSVSPNKIYKNKLPFACSIIDHIDSEDIERLEAMKDQLINDSKLEKAQNGEDVAFPISAKADLLRSFERLKTMVADHRKNKAIINMAAELEDSKKHQKPTK